MLKPTPGIAASLLQPGEVVAGRYRVTRDLSQAKAEAQAAAGQDDGGLRGMSSATYSAIDLTSSAQEHAAVHKVVTLRVLPGCRPTGEPYLLDDEERAHLGHQAAQLCQVQHASVAQTYGLTLQPELGVVLAREPVELDGQTLRDVLAVRGGPLPELEAIQLCAQIGEALEAAHLQGACHLGLSPACIFVFPDGAGVRVKVADFGLLPPAWAARAGEPGYLAPEQVDFVSGEKAEGKLDGPSYDRRTDQFALAVILYEMLAGQPAFVAAAEEDRQVILGRVRNEDPLPLSQSRAVEQALARALSRSPAVRFPSVRDFVRALGADVSSWPAGSAVAAGAQPAAGSPAPRFALPMAVGAVFSLVGLGTVVAVRQLTLPPPASLQLHDLRDFGQPPGAPAVPAVPAGNDLALGSPEDLLARVPASPDGGGGGAGGALPPHDPAVTRQRPSLVARPASRESEPTPLRPDGTQSSVQAAATQSPAVMSAQALGPLSFDGPEIGSLTGDQRSQLTSCVRMISPRPPFKIVVQNIAGVLYVDSNQTSAQISGSQDFRDCLKLRIKGKIVPKVLTIIRTSKGKAP